MARRTAIALAVLGLVAILAVFALRRGHETVALVAPVPAAGVSGGPTRPLAAPTQTAAPLPPPVPDGAQFAAVTAEGIRVFPEADDLVRGLNDGSEAPERDIEILDGVIAEYRRVFGQNPEGGLNVEIVRSLLGSNSRRLAIMPRDFPALNSRGELVDRWGTPFYFHPVSRTIMEIVSAGPDRQLWTPDDVGAITPADAEAPQKF